MTGPLVSVLMTSYNREKFIAEAIEGVLGSTYANFELIIVDDCSTDGTVAIAKEYLNKDSRISLQVNEKNLGQFPNRNKAATFAKGEFIMYADSDDILHAGTIEKCIQAMRQFPQSSFGMLFLQYGPPPFLLESKEAIQKHFFEKPILFIGPGSTIIRRSFFNRIEGYPTEYGVPGDMYFNLKATCYSPIVMLPFEFLYYRRHEGQEINNVYDYLVHNYRFLRDALKKLPLPITAEQKAFLDKKNKRRFVVSILKFIRNTKDFKTAAKALRESRFTVKDALVGVFH